MILGSSTQAPVFVLTVHPSTQVGLHAQVTLLRCPASPGTILVVVLASSAPLFTLIARLAIPPQPVPPAPILSLFQVPPVQRALQTARLAPVPPSVQSATAATSSLRTPALPAPPSTPIGQAATTIPLRPPPASLAPI